MNKIKIIGIVGSLREKSYNKKALLFIQDNIPSNAYLEILDISKIPFFNEDVEKKGVPKSVLNFKEKIALADAIIIASPEYNYSIPGVLKNALDWASRGDNLPLNKKPTAIISASLGMFGGSRVQYHLRQVCVSMNMLVMNKPEVFITKCHEKFSDNKLTDEYTQNALLKITNELIDFTKKIKK